MTVSLPERRLVGLGGLVVAVALLVAAVVVGVRTVGDRPTSVTAYFQETKGLYVGDDVTVLGVPVGRVTAVDPQPDRVRVELEVDPGVVVPATAKAVIVAPALVSVRSIELTPVYRTGDRLESGSTIPESRTAIPVEWDDVKEQLTRLSRALGPDGANADGSLSRLLDASAENLRGQGDDVAVTVRLLSEAMTTLDDNGGELFATVRNLRVLVDALEAGDAEVRRFNQRLAGAADVLAAERDELVTVLEATGTAFRDVEAFLRDNRGRLGDTVDELSTTVATLARNRQSIADLLQVVPSTLSNFYNIYDPEIPSMVGSLAPVQGMAPAELLCSMLLSVGGDKSLCSTALAQIAMGLDLPVPPISVSLLEHNGRGKPEGGTP